MAEPSDRPETTALLLGRLEGRLLAVEDRMDRYEAASAARLAIIEAKLDAVATSLAQGLGGVRVFHWIGGAILAGLGFVLNHLWPRN